MRLNAQTIRSRSQCQLLGQAPLPRWLTGLLALDRHLAATESCRHPESSGEDASAMATAVRRDAMRYPVIFGSRALMLGSAQYTAASFISPDSAASL